MYCLKHQFEFSKLLFHLEALTYIHVVFFISFSHIIVLKKVQIIVLKKVQNCNQKNKYMMYQKNIYVFNIKSKNGSLNKFKYICWS